MDKFYFFSTIGICLIDETFFFILWADFLKSDSRNRAEKKSQLIWVFSLQLLRNGVSTM